MHQVTQFREFWLETISGRRNLLKIFLLVIPILCFALHMTSYNAHAGEASLSWEPPTTNMDGSSLTDLAGYKIYYGTSSGTYDSTLNAGNVTTYTVSNLTGGTTYYFTVTAYDTSGNESGYSNEVSMTIAASTDTTAPVISGVTTSSITSNSAIITWTTDEAATSQVEYGTTTSYGSSTTLDSTLVTSHSVTLNGLTAWTTYHFRVKSQDAAGNPATSSDFTFTTLTPPDTTPPTGTISINSGATYVTSTSVTLNLSCSDAGSGCSQMRFSNDNTTWSAWESYTTSKTWTLTAGNGTKTVYVQYQDGAGYTSGSFSDTITLDATNPSGTISINSGATYATSPTVTLTLSCTDTGSGCSQMRLSNDGSTWNAWEGYGTSKTWTLQSGDGTKTVYIRYRDNAGNISSIYTDTITIDTTAPVISGVNASNVTDGGVTISWTTDEGATTEVEYGTTTGYGLSTQLDSNLLTAHGISITGLSPATTYHYRVISQDTAGNLSTSSDFTFTTLAPPDTTPPTGTISINSGATYATSISVTLSLSCNDTASGCSKMRFSNDNTAWSAWESYATSKAWTLTIGNGTKTAYVQYQDSAGNISVSLSDTIILDTTSPSGTISVNSGATYTTSATVTLTITCTDTGSGCSQVRLSNNGTTWNALENYSTSKAWTLSSGDGTKTVYIRFRDNAGNVSSNYTDTIILDTASPVISSVSANNATDSGVNIRWTTDEGATTKVEYGTTASYGLSTAINSNLVTTHSVSITGLSQTTTYHYRVISQDAAGNIAVSSDYTFTTIATPDTTPPVISGVSVSNITTSGSTITWTTDEPSTSQVEYGTSTLYGSFSSLSSTLMTSHTVTLSGLTHNTVYYFRVHSVDLSGNKGTSGGYNFTTLKIVQPDTPAAITDLRIRAGSNTRNSVILEWTATGSDGIEGTASGYDLRISTKKIIDDGITPANGEINFTNATRITGLPAPSVASTQESFQVSGLETNSVYYLAIKAIDEKGNTSALSNVINGANVPPLPVTALRQGYTMISLPLTPYTFNVQDLLGGIVGEPVELYWWSSNGPGDNNGSFRAETNIVPGYGYFLKSSIDNAVLNISGSVVADMSRAISLQPGWNMIGNPYPGEVYLRDTYIHKIDSPEDTKSYEDAVIAGWVGNALYSYNGSTYNFEIYTDALLKLWHGYWIPVLKDGLYEMIIYKP